MCTRGFSLAAISKGHTMTTVLSDSCERYNNTILFLSHINLLYVILSNVCVLKTGFFYGILPRQ